MRTHTHRTAIAAAALALCALAAPAAYAVCEAGDRVAHTEAECLDASWTEGTASITGVERDVFSVSNQCAEHGVVTARVEGEDGAASQTIDSMGDDAPRTGTVMGGIKQAWCCQDRSDLCNVSDITPEACLENFERSSATGSCTGTTASVASNQCVLTSTCSHGTITVDSTITVSLGEVRQLYMDLTTRTLSITGERQTISK